MEASANADMNFSEENVVLSKQNVLDLCRLCANAHDKLMPIFNGEGLVLNISDKLEKYLPIIKVMESDELPLQICYQCTSILLAWHDLFEGCSTANLRLRGILALDENFSDNITGSDEFEGDADSHLMKRFEVRKANSRMECGKTRNWDTSEDRNKFDEIIGETGSEHTNVGSKYRSSVIRAEGPARKRPSSKEDLIKRTSFQLVTEKMPYKEDIFARNINAIPNSDVICCSHFNDDNSLSVKPEDMTCKSSPENNSKCSLYIGILKCNFCSMVLTNKREIECHLCTSHADTSPVNHTKGRTNSYSSKPLKKMKKCQVKQSLNGDDVAQSRCDSVSKGFKCDICSKICLTARGLIRHSVVHKQEEIPVNGDYGAQSFSDNDTKQIHFIDCHHIKSDIPSSEVDSEPQNFLPDQSSSFEASTNALNEPDMEQMNTNEPETITDEILEAKILTCSECSESFDQEQMLILHQHTQHNKTDELACKHCDEKFTDDELLKKHLSNRHRKKKIKNLELDDPFVQWYINIDGQKYLKCDQCKYNSMWYHKSRFLEHYRIHTGEKPFTCDLCQKQFRTKSLLSKHVMFVHEGIKEFPCTICGRRFSDKRYVIEHTRIHTNERPYICDLCGKSFRQSASLFVHKELHKGLRKFHCEMCPSKFTTRSSLNMHIKRHIGERNFICAICGKAFVDGKHLRDHMTVHSEERPFACKLCDRKFKLLKHLKQHGRTHK